MARKKTEETFTETETAEENAAVEETLSVEPEAVAETAETETEKPEAVAKTAESGMRFPDPCVYCGPSVKGVARQYTTYQGGIPTALENFVREHPAARGLIVSTGRFPAVRQRLDVKGSAEAILYQRVKSEL